jgi:peptidoglycan/LPS O-acetylase OafA/YrhL
MAPYAYLQSGVLLPVFLALIAGLASPNVVSRAFAWRPIAALGHASYATYILHVPLFLALARFDDDFWHHLSGRHLAIYGAALLAMSLGAYRFVEEPCRRWIVS